MSRKTLALLAAAALALYGTGAHAASYTFSGLSGAGGAISGSFSGVDANANGLIEAFGPGGAPEVTAFSLSFAGDPIVPAFAAGLADLQLFAFRVDSNNKKPAAIPAGQLSPVQYHFGVSQDWRNGRCRCTFHHVCCDQ